MLARIKALNESSSEESDSDDDEKEPTLTREALEELALKEYQRALQLKAAGKEDAAIELMSDLLTTELLVGVKKPEVEDKVDRPMLKLKYCCHRNIAISADESGDTEKALHHYCLACELDGSDCHLWYKLGSLAMKTNKFLLARFAFDQGFECNPDHWPCLDALIRLLYATNHQAQCLYYISLALKKEAGYLRGQALKELIYDERPNMKEYFTNLVFPPSLEGEDYSVYIADVMDLKDKWSEQCKEPEPADEPEIPAFGEEKLTWISLANALLKVHQFIVDNNIMIARAIDLPMVLQLLDKSETMETEIIPTMNEPKETAIEKTERSEVCDIKNNDKRDEIDVDLPSNSNTEKMTEGLSLSDENGVKAGTFEKKVSFESEDNTKDKENIIEGNSKRRRGSDLALLEQWGWSKQRRSARRKDKEKDKYTAGDENIEEALRRLLPTSLIPNGLKVFRRKESQDIHLDDSLDTMDLYRLFESNEANPKSTDSDNQKCAPTAEEIDQFRKIEEIEVKEFVDKFTVEKKDVIDLMAEWLKYVSDISNMAWPAGLSEYYVDIYQQYRQVYAEHPWIFTKDKLELSKDAKITLLFLELLLDQSFQTIREKKQFHQAKVSVTDSMFEDDLAHVNLISWQREDLFPFDYMTHYLRVQWVRCHHFLFKKMPNEAIERLQHITFIIEQESKNTEKVSISLINCKINSTIDINTVETLLQNLKRTESVCSIEHLYEEKRYEEISDILQNSLSQGISASLYDDSGSLSKPVLLHILIESLWLTDKYQECFLWCESTLHEACHHYLAGIGSIQQEWGDLLQVSLMYIDLLMNIDGPLSPLKCLTDIQMTRFVLSLANIVIHQLDDRSPGLQAQTTTKIDVIKPWIILYHILFFEEMRGRCGSKRKRFRPGYSKIVVENKLNGKQESDEDEDDESELLLATKLLFTAHEHLGRRSLCCANNGALLLHILDTTASQAKAEAFQEVLAEHLEQCCYCLYGHPSKKSKPRYLSEHDVQPISLTWKYAVLVYEMFRPDELPAFDSYKLASISAETESLFVRLIPLVPPENDPQTLSSGVIGFINGKSDVLPIKNINLPYQISNIYYLLADYYLRNREFPKALKHYVLDVCINPDRIDSWAGMALARASQLETRQNSCEAFRTENEFLDKANAAICCFKKSLNIDSLHSMLWIEYGSFVYSVHSHCSRLLKQASETLSMESFEVLESRKESMLDTAQVCFTEANNIQHEQDQSEHDERWLHHYMLGKVAEKRKEDPHVYLEHYQKASQFLFENKATYPRRINYNSPSKLAVEALEIYYRIHACILKYFEQHDHSSVPRKVGKLFLEHIMLANNGPYGISSAVLHSDKTAEANKSEVPTSNSKSDNNKPLESQITTSPENMTTTEQVQKADNVQLQNINQQGGSQNADRKRKAEESAEGAPEPKKHEKCIGDVLELSDDVIFIPDSDEDPLNISDCSDKPKEPVVEIIGDILPEKTPLVECNTNKVDTSETSRKMVFLNQDPQAIMDSLMEECMKTNALVEQGDESQTKCAIIDTPEVSIPKQSDNEQSDKRSDNDEKATPMDTSEVSVVPTAIRRGSHESQATNATTSTGTRPSSRNSTSSSSSSSSSSGNSSTTTDSSSDASDEESNGSKVAKSKHKTEKKTVEKDKPLTSSEVDEIVNLCLRSLEECAQRFSQHYKALYRLGNHYLHHSNKGSAHNNVQGTMLCKQLLMGTYERSPGNTIPGLFADRKSANLFNGVWRIPPNEVDRPGSFAAHMSRCVMLLMATLKELSEPKTLLELCLQLQRDPDADKRYIRDSERLELSEGALSLCVHSLRAQLRKLSDQKDQTKLNSFVLDVYRMYRKTQKNISKKEKMFSVLLVDTYKQLIQDKLPVPVSGNILEVAIRFCQQQITAKKQLSRNKIEVNKQIASQQPYQIGMIYPPPRPNMLNPTSIAMNPTIPTAAKRGRPPGVNSASYRNTLRNPTMNPLMNAMNSMANTSSMSTVSSYMSMLPMFSDHSLMSAALQGKADTTMTAALDYLTNLNKLNPPLNPFSNPTYQQMYPSYTDTLANNALATAYADLLRNTAISGVPNIMTSNAPSSKYVNSGSSFSQPKKQPKKNSNSSLKQAAGQKVTATNPAASHKKASMESTLKYKQTNHKEKTPAGQERISATISPVRLNTKVTQALKVPSVSHSRMQTTKTSPLGHPPKLPSSTTLTATIPKLPTTSTYSSMAISSSVSITPAIKKTTNLSKSAEHSVTLQKIPLTGVAKPAHTSHMHSSRTNNMPAHSQKVPQQSMSIIPVQPAHVTQSTHINNCPESKPPPPHVQTSPGKTLQQKLAERQKNNPSASTARSNPPATLPALPSSLTVTKTTVTQSTGTKSKSKLITFRKNSTSSSGSNPSTATVTPVSKKTSAVDPFINKGPLVSVIKKKVDQPSITKNATPASPAPLKACNDVIVIDDD